jgi:hypothetical protein
MSHGITILEGLTEAQQQLIIDDEQDLIDIAGQTPWS